MITYAAARLAILDHLAGLGWEVKRGLKVPQAIEPNGGVHLYFKSQAVYLGSHSLHVDIRLCSPGDFVVYVKRWAP